MIEKCFLSLIAITNGERQKERSKEVKSYFSPLSRKSNYTVEKSSYRERYALSVYFVY